MCDRSARSPGRVCVGDVYIQGVCTGVCVCVGGCCMGSVGRRKVDQLGEESR